MRPRYSEQRFLEDEEADYAALRSRDADPLEEHGLVSIGGAINRAVSVAGAKFAIAPECESPIEATMGGRLKLMVEEWNAKNALKIKLVQQYQLHRFRYDFAILLADETLILAIECDGRDFHSSDEARANDANKNKAIWALGAEIFRFSGSKIFRREADCIARVEAYLKQKFQGS